MNRLIDIGGRKLFARLSGKGSPAVIVESGMGSISTEYRHAQRGIAAFTQALSYDRAGLGRSDPAPAPRTCQDVVNDLSALLSVLHLAPPYILVGHSWGGLSARLFASQHPTEIAGLVLVDASHEDKTEHFERVLSPDLIERNRRYLNDPTRNSENLDIPACNAQVRAAQQVFNFPLIVITRGLPAPHSSVWPDELDTIEVELQKEFLKFSPHSKQIIAEHSGHLICQDQPELVIAAVKELIDLAKANSDEGQYSIH